MTYEVNEKQQRIKYIRVLEKFFTRTISLLKLENFDKDLFKQRTKKNYDDMKKTQEVDLYSEYYAGLKDFINKTMFYVETKEKNKSNYKKDKHKKQTFNDGY